MRHRRAAWALSVWMGCAGGVAAAGGQVLPQAEPIELKVRLYTEVDVPWLPGAQAVVERVLAAGAIHVTWIDCRAEPECGVGPAPNELVVRIVRRRLDPASHGCGVALRPDAVTGHYMTLFVDCIRDGAETFRVAESVLAGHCLAHEIGHLLLPTGAHAPIGIMRARPDRFDWERGARGALDFRPVEQRQMYQALRRRTASMR